MGESYDIKSHSVGPTRGFAVPFKQGNGALFGRLKEQRFIKFDPSVKISITYLDETDEEKTTEFHNVKYIAMWTVNQMLEITSKFGYESIVYRIHKDVIINYFKTLENREVAYLSIPRRNIIKLDKLANGMKVGTWFE